jgi:hypothetical protein
MRVMRNEYQAALTAIYVLAERNRQDYVALYGVYDSQGKFSQALLWQYIKKTFADYPEQ